MAATVGREPSEEDISREEDSSRPGAPGVSRPGRQLEEVEVAE